MTEKELLEVLKQYIAGLTASCPQCAAVYAYELGDMTKTISAIERFRRNYDV